MSDTKVSTGKVRLSYESLLKPKKFEESDEAKYSTSVLVPKKDTKTIKALEAAIEAAIEVGKGKLWNGKKPSGAFKTPLRDGDEEFPDDPNYKGMIFFTASSKDRPGIVDEDLQPVTDATEVYSGRFARLSLNAYPFKVKSNGIAMGLNNVMLLTGGEPLGGGKSDPKDDFKDSDFSDEWEDGEESDMW